MPGIEIQEQNVLRIKLYLPCFSSGRAGIMSLMADLSAIVTDYQLFDRFFNK